MEQTLQDTIAILTVANSRGWYLMQALSASAIDQMIDCAVAEDDPVTSDSLWHEAKAAKKFWAAFAAAVESSRDIDLSAPADTASADSSIPFMYDPAME